MEIRIFLPASNKLHGEFGGLQMYAYGPAARPGNAVAKEREE